MNELLANLLRIPFDIAQVSSNQIQRLVRSSGTNRAAPPRGFYWTNNQQRSGSDLVGTVVDSGRRLAREFGLDRNSPPDLNRANETFYDPSITPPLVDDRTLLPKQEADFNRGGQPVSDELTNEDASLPGVIDGSNSTDATASLPEPLVQPLPQMVPQVSPADLGSIRLTNMVVIGDRFAAGAGDFSWSADAQRTSFPAQLALHAGVEFLQPVLQSPGLPLPNVTAEELRLPDLGQTTVLEEFPARAFGNRAIPGMTISDCLRQRPSTPLIQPNDTKQTLLNLTLGHQLWDGKSQERPTAIESLIASNPSFVVVAVGFEECLQAAQNQQQPDVERLKRDYQTLFSQLDQLDCEVVVMNIPNPFDTAAFSSIDSAARVLKLDADSLTSHFKLAANDWLAPAALMEIGSQLNRSRIEAIDESMIVSGEFFEQFSENLEDLNRTIATQSNDHDHCCVCDVSDLFQQIEAGTVSIGTLRLNSDFMGGCFGLCGYSFGRSFNTLIANHLIEAMNREFDCSLPLIDPELVIATDPIADCRIAEGRNWYESELQAMQHLEATALSPTGPSSQRSLIPFDKSDRTLDLEYNATHRNPPKQPLQLPPDLEQTLPLNRDLSYHGDAMRVLHCQQPNEARWGSCGNNVFDGLAMFGAHLEGALHFKFEPPVNDVSHFEVTLQGPLTSDDGVLSTPSLLKFPLNQPQVVQPPGTVCSGDVNLVTGTVTNLDFAFFFQNSGLQVLQDLNPETFPSPPMIRYKNPIAPEERGLIYSSAWARFAQRSDGTLDFLFHGTSFVPMFPGFRFALPFGSPDGDFATVPASGTQLHPRLHLNTTDNEFSDAELPNPESNSQNEVAPIVPVNSVQQFTTDAGRSCFGDDFKLNHPELGFARGRSYLTGRILIQFGERFGDSVSFSVTMLPPGGLMQDRSLSPLQEVFPGQLVPGMEGHDAVLRFPRRTYRQNDMFLIDDPFDFAVGAVNIYTGEVIGDFVHRAFLGQALFYALVRVEPRTPQGSFEYRGASVFRRGPNGQLRYRFNGSVYILYPEGFLFPLPDLSNGIPIGSDSQLDPYFQIEATLESERETNKSGGANNIIAISGDRFSYRYSVSNRPNQRATFEYTNHSQDGTFQMQSLASIRFCNARSRGKYDLVVFTGFGYWSKDEEEILHFASVQISSEPGRPYVSILIDGGSVSNVNTRPTSETAPLTALEDSGD